MAISPGQYDFTLQRRADHPLSLQILVNDTPLNLTAWTVTATVWNLDRTTEYAQFAVSYPNRVSGYVDLLLTHTQTVWFPSEAYYDVLLTNQAGLREYYLEGHITVSEGYST